MSLLQSRHEVKSPQDADSGFGSARAVQGKPNIVLWLPDDMFLKEYAWWLEDDDSAPKAPDLFPIDHLPIHNREVMPNLQRIAQTGATFKRAYSTSSMCTPSRYSIMTGRYPSKSMYGMHLTTKILGLTEHAFVSMDYSLLGKAYSDTQNTVAANLRRLGYTTGMTGKWHISPDSEGATFTAPYSAQQACVKRSGFDFVDGLYIANMCECGSSFCDTFSHNLEWTLVRSLEFMDGAMRSNLPFFLYFNPTPPHSPGVEVALLGERSPLNTPAGKLSKLPEISRFCSSCTFATRSEIWASSANASLTMGSEYCRTQLAALRWLDESLGVLYQFLSERGALANTYIVMATDHGTAKYTLYDLGTRVPMYAIGPSIQAGIVISELVSHVDLAPTFLEWAGGDSSSKSMDGISWASMASGQGPDYLERDGIWTESQFDKAFMSRDGMKNYEVNTAEMLTGSKYRSKLSQNFAHYVGAAYPHLYAERQVYNLSADALEQVNLG
jgi:arylsulfatase A-like enzyme